jgi:hypothetical protein
MTSQVHTIAVLPSTDRVVSPVRKILTERSSLFSDVMDALGGWLGGRKVTEQMAELFECDVRSAARYRAGERTPPGDVVFALLLVPKIGPRVLARVMERAERELSPADFTMFRLEMARAALRADVRENNQRHGAPLTD